MVSLGERSGILNNQSEVDLRDQLQAFWFGTIFSSAMVLLAVAWTEFF